MSIKISKKSKDLIFEFFEKGNQRVFRHSDFRNLLAKYRSEWFLSSAITIKDFIQFLLKNKQLISSEFKFNSRKEILFTWGEVSIFELAPRLKANSYLSHYSAMYLHEITEQIPKTIYLNQEQPKKSSKDVALEQTNIDRAFKNKVRVSHTIANFQNHNICILNGMNTGNLGVINVVGASNQQIPVTNIERTLIDITVRPVYAGGVFEVLKAYKLAAPKISVNRMVAYLDKINYKYPYHQAIGFYLERTGEYRESLIELLDRFEIKYDFYLIHNMNAISYSKRWRLFYPEGF
jgi:hypothetical protein